MKGTSFTDDTFTDDTDDPRPTRTRAARALPVAPSCDGTRAFRQTRPKRPPARAAGRYATLEERAEAPKLPGGVAAESPPALPESRRAIPLACAAAAAIILLLLLLQPQAQPESPPPPTSCYCFDVCNQTALRRWHLRLPKVTSRESPWRGHVLPTTRCCALLTLDGRHVSGMTTSKRSTIRTSRSRSTCRRSASSTCICCPRGSAPSNSRRGHPASRRRATAGCSARFQAVSGSGSTTWTGR